MNKIAKFFLVTILSCCTVSVSQSADTASGQIYRADCWGGAVHVFGAKNDELALEMGRDLCSARGLFKLKRKDLFSDICRPCEPKKLGSVEFLKI